MSDAWSRNNPTSAARTSAPAAIVPADGCAWSAPDPASLVALATGHISECKLVPWGSNYTFAVALDVAGAEPVTGIYKPERGEIPLWDFETGTLYRREYAAFVLSCLLGWHFIPPTVVRDGPHGIGTVQLYVEPDESMHDRTIRRAYHDQLQRIALFDLMTNNADRKASHCFVGRLDRRLWGIDHGLTFHVQPKLRTVIWDFCGEPIEGELLVTLEALLTHRADVRAALRPFLSRPEIDMLFARVANIRDSQLFPMLNPRRNVPYGW
ncbi:MAG TPA: SCO1664 family protein [Thermomicrobiaceae bacterium]|nr:SCO1664 family protein [Thermomicrobiaceae bacterium]